MEPDEDEEWPENFCCPITHEVMEDPFIIGDGHTYEGNVIKTYLEANNWISPMTRQPVDRQTLFLNRNLKETIMKEKAARAARTAAGTGVSGPKNKAPKTKQQARPTRRHGRKKGEYRQGGGVVEIVSSDEASSMDEGDNSSSEGSDGDPASQGIYLVTVFGNEPMWTRQLTEDDEDLLSLDEKICLDIQQYEGRGTPATNGSDDTVLFKFRYNERVSQLFNLAVPSIRRKYDSYRQHWSCAMSTLGTLVEFCQRLGASKHAVTRRAYEEYAKPSCLPDAYTITVQLREDMDQARLDFNFLPKKYPFQLEYVERLKSLVPKQHRTYDRASFEWRVDRCELKPFLQSIMGEFTVPPKLLNMCTHPDDIAAAPPVSNPALVDAAEDAETTSQPQPGTSGEATAAIVREQRSRFLDSLDPQVERPDPELALSVQSGPIDPAPCAQVKPSGARPVAVRSLITVPERFDSDSDIAAVKPSRKRVVVLDDDDEDGSESDSGTPVGPSPGCSTKTTPKLRRVVPVGGGRSSKRNATERDAVRPDSSAVAFVLPDDDEGGKVVLPLAMRPVAVRSAISPPSLSPARMVIDGDDEDIPIRLLPRLVADVHGGNDVKQRGQRNAEPKKPAKKEKKNTAQKKTKAKKKSRRGADSDSEEPSSEEPVASSDEESGEGSDVSDDTPCFMCGEPGDIMGCSGDGCERWFHKDCVNLKKFPTGDWYCPRCVIRRQREAKERKEQKKTKRQKKGKKTAKPNGRQGVKRKGAGGTRRAHDSTSEESSSSEDEDESESEAPSSSDSEDGGLGMSRGTRRPTRAEKRQEDIDRRSRHRRKGAWK